MSSTEGSIANDGEVISHVNDCEAEANIPCETTSSPAQSADLQQPRPTTSAPPSNTIPISTPTPTPTPTPAHVAAGQAKSKAGELGWRSNQTPHHRRPFHFHLLPMGYCPHATGPYNPYASPGQHQRGSNPRNMPHGTGPRNFMSPYFHGPPYYMPAPYPLLSPEELKLRDDIRDQIEFYFSEKNRMYGEYHLITLMDKQGWVPIENIAEFRKIKAKNVDLEFILFALRFSKTIEVQGNKIRGRDNWSQWISKKSSRVDESR